MLSDGNFINIAKEVSKWSKCVSKKVWAVIVKDNRILSTWYNWTPSLYINCSDYWNSKYSKKHHDWSSKYEIHAEMNAVLWSARNGIEIKWASIYTTMEPCFQCTKNIIASWIKRIVYEKSYEHNDSLELAKFIKDTWVEIIKI